ncbi:MAG: phosphoenolpyruvate carboxylase [Nitrososphaerota archaeon]|jgi:phosphoenolpyruvate carboxylase|nr:phosphoenolpyruvate carboxylase [Nitrososphaerota archaeon]
MSDSPDRNRAIPNTMSTQHPDNASNPEWNKEEVINGNAEVLEAYHAYNTLGCQEVMWDSEGKDTDTHVSRKLFQKYWEYFASHTIGEDIFLTYRIPNPKIEGAEKKILTETLQNIPVATDVASMVYKREITPIFEVILPFTTEAKEIIMLCNYYKKAIVAAEDATLYENTTVKDWIGNVKPKALKVIPLVEDFNSILHVDNIILPYLKTIKPKQQRVFIARSDPALNYGYICAILLTKIALSKLKELEKQHCEIHPIIGVGSKPFRGHLSPDNIDNFLEEYKGISTVTIQSAFRYDYPVEQVKESIQILNQRLPNDNPEPISSEEEETLLRILHKFRSQYEHQIEILAPFINSVATYVPPRRARKLHIGLFGYSRCVAGVCLPRAISFAAALYSIGLPPEFIGMKVLDTLTDKEWSTLNKHYLKMNSDIKIMSEYLSMNNINMLQEMSHTTAKRAGMSEEKLKEALTSIVEDLKIVEKKLSLSLGPKGIAQRKHENFTNNFLLSFLQKQDTEAKTALVESSKLRKCLG